MSTNRKYPRLNHFAEIKVTFESAQSIIAKLRDLSEGGLFLLCSDTTDFAIGDRVTVQTLEFAGAPEQQAEIVRIEDGVGMAVKFTQTR